MIAIDFTSEEMDALKYERYHYLDSKVQKKMKVLYLKSQKVEHQEICQLYRISKPTLWPNAIKLWKSLHPTRRE